MIIFFTSFIRFPNEKAHGKQVKEVCNSLVAYAPVTLVLPNRRTNMSYDEFGLDPRIKVVKVPSLDFTQFQWLGKIGWSISALSFTIAAAVYLLLQKLQSKKPVVITREYFCAIAPAVFGIPTIWESHRGQWGWMPALVKRLGVQFFVISQGLYDLYLSKGVSDQKLTLVPDGVDLWRYEHLPTRSEARTQLSLSADEFIVVYNGNLQAWKGVNTLAAAAAQLPVPARVIFMGGSDDEIISFSAVWEGKPAVSIIGRKDDTTRPVYLRAANVLVIPNTAKTEISAKYTSPLKLFGYMATEVPIVASDLPSIREIVSEKEAFFATPDDVGSLVQALDQVRQNPQAAQDRAIRARSIVGGYAWDVRAKRIVQILQDLVK